MGTLRRKLLNWFHYRITHTRKFPKGDLVSFLLHIARRGFEPTHIVDVGANKAKWSRKARRIFPQCNFTLIEPQTETQQYLDNFCRRNNRCQWINAGMSDEIGELPFTVAPDTVSSSFTISKEDADAAGFARRIVPTITLDHLVENVIHDVPELVKIDAEGFEYQIMQGAQSLIGKTELFLLEAPLSKPPHNWYSFSELLTMMLDFGYDLYDFTTFQRRKRDGALALCEIAFARADGFLFAGNRTPRQSENTELLQFKVSANRENNVAGQRQQFLGQRLTNLQVDQSDRLPGLAASTDDSHKD